MHSLFPPRINYYYYYYYYLPSFKSNRLANTQFPKPFTGRECTWIIDAVVGLGGHARCGDAFEGKGYLRGRAAGDGCSTEEDDSVTT